MSHLWQSLKSSISAIRYSDDQYGKAFLIASDTGDLDKMLQHIETRGVSYQDEYGQRPLHRASRRGHTSAVRMLLEYGSDPNLKDHVGAYTSLQYAAHYQHAEVVRLLVAYGADPYYCNKIACRSAAYYATVHPHIKQAIQQGISDLYIHRSIAASHLMSELDALAMPHSQPLRHSIAMAVVEFIPRHQLWHQRKTRYITDATTNWHSSQLFFADPEFHNKSVIHTCRYHGEFDIDTDWDAIQAQKKQNEAKDDYDDSSGDMEDSESDDSESESAYYESQTESDTDSDIGHERKYNEDEYYSTSTSMSVSPSNERDDAEYKSLSSDEDDRANYLSVMQRRAMITPHHHRRQLRRKRRRHRQRQRPRHAALHTTQYYMNRWWWILSVLVVVIAVLSVFALEHMDVDVEVVRESMYKLYRCFLSVLLDHKFIS